LKFSNYNLSAGQQSDAPANVIGANKAQAITDVSFEKTGAIQAVKANTVAYSFGLSGDVTGVHIYNDGIASRLISIAGTGIYYNDIQVKQIPYTGKYTFCDHNQAVYCASAENTLCKITHGGNAYLMGSPQPATKVTLAQAGDDIVDPPGNMNCGDAKNDPYRIAMTYVTEHTSSGGGVYQTEGNPGTPTQIENLSASRVIVSDIPSFSDSNAYNIVNKRLYIYGGEDPNFSDYFRVYSDTSGSGTYSSQMAATVTSATINPLALDRWDETRVLIDDNDLPPRAAYIVNNFDHFALTGNPNYPDRWYYGKVSSENIPSNNWIKEDSEIMGMAKWNNSVWTPTRDGLKVKVGANENNFYNQDTDVSDGCVAPHTLCGTPYGLIYLSYNGVVRYTGQQNVQILSKELDDVFLNLPAEHYENACATYFDHEYWISVTTEGSTSNDHTYIYNFLTNGWRVSHTAYLCFGKDERKFKLYGSYSGGSEVHEIAGDDTYSGWHYFTREYEMKLYPEAPPIRMFPTLLHLDIDTKGEDVLAIPYYDGVAVAGITVNSASRENKTYRLPEGNCYRMSIKFIQGDSNYQTIFYNYDIEANK